MKQLRTLAKIASVVVLAVWPILVDQQDMGCWFSPNACTDGEPIAFGLKILSLLLAGFLAALLISPRNKKTWQVWVVRVAVILLVVGVGYSITFVADFSREFTF